MKLLNLLNYQLFEQYEAIIDAMNQGYDRTAGICHYRDIEEMIRNRNRTIHDHLARGNAHSQNNLQSNNTQTQSFRTRY